MERYRTGLPGIGLVAHCGSNTSGEFIYTLDVTDVATTKQKQLKKAQVWVFDALEDITKNLPFEVKGINSDKNAIHQSSLTQLLPTKGDHLYQVQTVQEER